MILTKYVLQVVIAVSVLLCTSIYLKKKIIFLLIFFQTERSFDVYDGFLYLANGDKFYPAHPSILTSTCNELKYLKLVKKKYLKKKIFNSLSISFQNFRTYFM